MTAEELQGIESRFKGMNRRLDEMTESIKGGPSFNTKQVIAILVLFFITVFSAGAWASSMQAGLKTNTETLIEIRGDLKQLGEVAVLKAQVEYLKSQINTMQIRLDSGGR